MAEPTITDERLRALLTQSLQGRQNAHKRALRKDIQAALTGDACCRESVAQRDQLARMLEIPPYLVDALEDYNAHDYNRKTDPSGLGGLNAVAYIGEQLAMLWRLHTVEVATAPKSTLRYRYHCRACKARGRWRANPNDATADAEVHTDKRGATHRTVLIDSEGKDHGDAD